MTTAINENHRKGLPEPHAYPQHVAAILAARKPRTRRWLVYSLALTVFASLWLVPLWVLASIIGGLLCLFAWFIWAIYKDSKEYGQEHDLP